MAQFIKASKDTLVDLNKVCSASHDASGFHSISGHTKSVVLLLDNGEPITIQESDEQYTSWLKWMEQQETLKQSQVREIREEAFDPFLDEMPRTLFGLFQSLPGSEKLTLTLGTDGGGHMDNMISGDQLIWWDTFEEALEKIMDEKLRLANARSEEK